MLVTVDRSRKVLLHSRHSKHNITIECVFAPIALPATDPLHGSQIKEIHCRNAAEMTLIPLISGYSRDSVAEVAVEVREHAPNTETVAKTTLEY